MNSPLGVGKWRTTSDIFDIEFKGD